MRLLRWFARQLFWILGWKLVGTPPPGLKKAVVVLAPHTSNWDGFYGLLYAFAQQAPLRFAAKKELKAFPLGYFLRRLGMIPIDRQRGAGAQDMVAAMAGLFQTRSELMLVIAPEGTRKRVRRWRRGFYHVAQQANVPIVLFFIDYGKRQLGVGPVVEPTGAVKEDIQQMQAFYQDKQGRYPDQGVVVEA